MNTAKQRMATGRFAEAVQIYQEMTAAMPGNPGLVLNLAIARHMAGQDREAIADFARVLKVQPSSMPANVLTGVSYLRLQEPKKAILFLEKAVQIQPKDGETRQMLADALLMTEQYGKAASQLRQLAEGMPEDPRIWFGLGRSYEALAQKAFSVIPAGTPYWYALAGETRLKERRYTAAFAAFKQAAPVPGLHRAVAEIYRQTGHQDWAAQEAAKETKLKCATPTPACEYEAGRFLQAATAATGSGPEAQYWRSKAYNELALDAFSQLSKLPASVELHQLLAGIARNQNRHRDAIAEWDKALKLAPGDPQLERELAISYYQAGDYAEAEQRLQAALSKSPAEDLNFYLGDTLLNVQRPAEALPHLEKAGTAPAVHAVLGRTLLQLNRPADALPHIRAALPIDSDGSLHYQAARAYQATGQTDLAKQAMAKYQELSRKGEGAEAAITAP